MLGRSFRNYEVVYSGRKLTEFRKISASIFGFYPKEEGRVFPFRNFCVQERKFRTYKVTLTFERLKSNTSYV